jgi:hypothetical protein
MIREIIQPYDTLMVYSHGSKLMREGCYMSRWDKSGALCFGRTQPLCEARQRITWRMRVVQK